MFANSMSRYIAVLILLVCVIMGFNRDMEPEGEPVSEKIAVTEIRKFVVREIAHIHKALVQLKSSHAKANKQEAYHTARKHYKRIEFFTEYISPRESKFFINGPLTDKHDPEVGNYPIHPNGFQKIEELLFSADTLSNLEELHKLADALHQQFSGLSDYYQSIDIDDGMILEMMQLQLHRLASLNLNGYDATYTQTNIPEASHALKGMQTCLTFYKPYLKTKAASNGYRQLQKQFDKSIAFLKSEQNYNTFPRLWFITRNINPLNALLVAFHNHTRLRWTDHKKALFLKSGSLFGRQSFNLRYFSIYYDDTLGLTKQADLGKLLFFEPLLSGNNTMSCASCHNPEKAFTDGLVKSITLTGQGTTLRNTPTLLNAIFQKSFFYDGRVYQLEAQIHEVIHNPVEMNSNFEEIVDKLRSRTTYRNLFKEAFPGTPEAEITPYAIQKALTEYEKTLVSFDSRFDRYLSGDYNSLDADEINGYNLFGGKALCGSCHFFPLFNGSVPPFYSESEFEIIGTPQTPENNSLDPDPGRFNVTRMDQHRNAFKTPSLRNIAYTAPYMHNGVYNKLEEVVDFYHKGGGAAFGFPVENQTLPFDSLSLSAKEKQDLIKFMLSLSDPSANKN